MNKTLVLLAVVAVACLAKPAADERSLHRAVEFREHERIVNGEEVPQDAMRYQASLQTASDTSESRHYCGGALLSDLWVATAAHCVVEKKPESLRVVLGAHKLSGDNPTYRAEDIFVYDYDKKTKKGDIALIKLKEDDQMESRVEAHPFEPVNICDDDFDATGRDCFVSGWGHLKSHDRMVPDNLRAAAVRVVSQDGCFKMFNRNGIKYPWDSRDDTMVCAGGESTDACQGDSGGPLVCPVTDRSGKKTADCLYGIVSWGIGCATRGYPGAYTNVRKFSSWVRDVWKNHGD